MNGNFNFFEILSAGDKELVHSSMIKLLLENEMTKKDFLKLLSIDHDIHNIIVDREKAGDKGSRYDLKFNISDDLECIIENKFKAVPYIQQVKKYVAKNRKLILIVFSSDFVAGFDKIELGDFTLISYISFTKNNKSILSFLGDYINKQSLNRANNKENDFDILLRHYHLYLSGFQEKLHPLITSEKCNFLELTREKSVFLLRSYLFHLQAKIINTGAASQQDLFEFWSPGNDGGSNRNPCVSFYRKNENPRFYVEFQGAILKSGVLFNVQLDDDNAKAKKLKKLMIDTIRSHENDFNVLFKDVRINEHSSLRKIKENKSSSSSMAFKFDLSDTQLNKELLVHDVVKVLKIIKRLSYYN